METKSKNGKTKIASAKSAIAKKKRKLPVAIQLSTKDGEHHVVGLGNIRVLLLPDDGAWYAQGLDIDYAVQGETLEEAKKEFEEGLDAMVHEHIRVYGNIKRMLKVAPDEMWNLANDPAAQLRRYGQVTHHHVIGEKSKYKGIEYLITAAQSEAASQ
jgi:predicted RNase H-like HicB family nuclease